jgi:hypothetical protein
VKIPINAFKNKRIIQIILFDENNEPKNQRKEVAMQGPNR